MKKARFLCHRILNLMKGIGIFSKFMVIFFPVLLATLELVSIVYSAFLETPEFSNLRYYKGKQSKILDFRKQNQCSLKCLNKHISLISFLNYNPNFSS